MTDLKIKKIHPRFKTVTCKYCGKEIVQADVWKIERGKVVEFSCMDCHSTLDKLL